MQSRVLVIGADGAGMSAAHQALRTARARGRELQVTVLERTGHTSYSSCGVPYWVAGDVGGPDDLVARTAQQHRAAGIDLRLRTEAVALDLRARTAVARDVVTGQRSSWGFDELVLATGSLPRTPDWALAPDGRWVPGVRAVKTLDDGAAWLDLLAGITPGRTGRRRRGVVVGGGYIGVEMAEAFVRRGLSTTLVTRRAVMGSLEAPLGARLRAGLERAGVEVVTGEEVDGLETRADGSVACVVAGPHRFPADVVALGVGSAPVTSLAVEAGLPVGAVGGLLPDERQQVAEAVWAAGDCCESWARLGNHRVFVPLGTHATKQGRVAGENLAGGDARFQGVLGTAITRFAASGVHVEVARTGPTAAQALEAGFEVAELLTESTTASGYMPEATPVAVLALADRRTRRLLGVQLVGGAGAGKRIDTAAVAVWTAASVDDVAAMDLSYAPPFSPVYDPVQIACRRLAERL